MIIHAWQWDTDVPVQIPWAGSELPTLDFVHQDTHTGKAVIPELRDGTLTARCPPSLLQSARRIVVYTRMDNTLAKAAAICVQPRPKPPEYVDAPENIWTAEKAVARAMKAAISGDDFAAESLAALIETDMLPAVHDNGKILTDEAGRIVLRY